MSHGVDIITLPSNVLQKFLSHKKGIVVLSGVIPVPLPNFHRITQKGGMRLLFFFFFSKIMFMSTLTLKFPIPQSRQAINNYKVPRYSAGDASDVRLFDGEGCLLGIVEPKGREITASANSRAFLSNGLFDDFGDNGLKSK